jgi:predicted metal-dependent hydrolase
LYYLCPMYQYNDQELGKIIVKSNIRAKQIIARKRGDHIQLTVPPGFSPAGLPSVLNEMRRRLMEISSPKEQLITEETLLETYPFTARISRTHLVEKAKMQLKGRELTLLIPAGFELEHPVSQFTVKEMIRHALRHEAKRILTEKTVRFSEKHNLQVNGIRINKSVTRWGSCSRLKSINYSFYTMLLPEKQIDYVVLHELAHTVEMNHGERFWRLLDHLCGEDAKTISRSLNKFESAAYQLLKP